jgi:hypothetical protein
MRAVVTGMIGNYPVGGVVWDYAQYALGLERLGFEVFYLEDTGLHVYDAEQQTYVESSRYGVRFLADSLASLSPKLGRRWAFRDASGTLFGMKEDELASVLSSADLLLNVSGGTLLRESYIKCRRKVLIDTDPGLSQMVNYPRWDASPGWQGTAGFRGHDYFFSYAQNIGKAGCNLPTLGLNWYATRPPVVLDHWRPLPPGERWTTVLTWNNYGKPLVYEGVVYGSKELEFEKILQLPRRTAVVLEVAAGGVDPPKESWRGMGWSVIDSHSVSATPDAYRDYIQRSRGEFSVAKNIYVDTHSGWFSCRSICYLAASRPVVVQDTGFSRHIPCGEGLLAFSTMDEAQRAIESVESNYAQHQRAARDVACRYFTSDIVLWDLLAKVGLQ